MISTIDRKGYSYFRFPAGLPFLLTKSGGENPSNWHPGLIGTSMPVTLLWATCNGHRSVLIGSVGLKGSGVVPRQTPQRNGSACCCCHLMKMEKCKQGRPEIGKRVSGLYVDFNRRDVSQLAKCIDSSTRAVSAHYLSCQAPVRGGEENAWFSNLIDIVLEPTSTDVCDLRRAIKAIKLYDLLAAHIRSKSGRVARRDRRGRGRAPGLTKSESPTQVRSVVMPPINCQFDQFGSKVK